MNSGTTAVRGVVWDMGGIVYRTPFEVFGELERARGVPAGTLPRGPFAPAGSPARAAYAEVDAGTVREPDFWQAVNRAARAAGLDLDVHRDITWPGRERPEVLAALELIGDRVPQLLLTNDATAFLGRGWERSWALARHFRGIVDSVHLGVRKPDARAYLAAAAELDLPPEDCLFVDDLRVNVAAAERAGMAGEWFDVTDPAGSVRRVLRRVDPALEDAVPPSQAATREVAQSL